VCIVGVVPSCVRRVSGACSVPAWTGSGARALRLGRLPRDTRLRSYWPVAPDAGQRDVTPAFRINSTQGGEGAGRYVTLSTRTMVTTSASTSYSTR
jgi:hypothetical protein